MKLLVIGTDTSVFAPGSEARSRIEAYARLFQEFHVVVFTPRGFAETQTASGAHLYPTNSRWFFRRPFDAARIAGRIVRERDVDLVSAQDPAESGLAGWLVKRQTGTPLHIQVHADILSPYFRRNSWKDRLRFYLSRFILPRGDLFRVVSARIRDSLRSKFPIGPGPRALGHIPNPRITVLPIFVDRERIANAAPTVNLRERYPEFDFIVLMVSRLNRDKRIDVAIDAFARFHRDVPKSGLVIVGDGPERKNLELKTSNLKLTDYVRFEGWRDDPVSYYKSADCYLLTSAFEGYGRSVIEAAAAGLPVIMTDVGVAGSVIRNGETGRVVPVGDAHEIARALGEIRRTPEAARRMAERARQEVLADEPRMWQAYLERYRLAHQTALRGISPTNISS